MPFTSVAHVIDSIDAQPSGVPGALLVLVQGMLKIDDDEHPLKFVQTWHLLPEESTGSYWVHNDIFRLAIGDRA